MELNEAIQKGIVEKVDKESKIIDKEILESQKDFNKGHQSLKEGDCKWRIIAFIC